jgi:triosephosphate isomerase
MNNYLIGNWKLNITYKESLEWVGIWEKFPRLDNLNIIVCPAYPLIYNVSTLKGVACGAQSVSRFTNGSHTGEVSANQFPPFVKHCIVGHSETRLSLQESLEDIKEKLGVLLQHNITPIYCFDSCDELPSISNLLEHSVLVFEPTRNISVGNQYKDVSYEMLSSNIETIKKVFKATAPILYGGSANSSTAKNIKAIGFNGLLLGKSSLDPEEFYKVGKIWAEN